VTESNDSNEDRKERIVREIWGELVLESRNPIGMTNLRKTKDRKQIQPNDDKAQESNHS
jgi:hypothetical protein